MKAHNQSIPDQPYFNIFWKKNKKESKCLRSQSLCLFFKNTVQVDSDKHPPSTLDFQLKLYEIKLPLTLKKGHYIESIYLANYIMSSLINFKAPSPHLIIIYFGYFSKECIPLYYIIFLLLFFPLFSL